MSDPPIIPSRHFPRDIRELTKWQWDPRLKYARERVEVEMPPLKPSVDLPPAINPDLGQELDRRG